MDYNRSLAKGQSSSTKRSLHKVKRQRHADLLITHLLGVLASAKVSGLSVAEVAAAHAARVEGVPSLLWRAPGLGSTGSSHINGYKSPVPLLQIILNFLANGQRAETSGLNVALVDKYICRVILWNDETESFLH